MARLLWVYSDLVAVWVFSNPPKQAIHGLGAGHVSRCWRASKGTCVHFNMVYSLQSTTRTWKASLGRCVLWGLL